MNYLVVQKSLFFDQNFAPPIPPTFRPISKICDVSLNFFASLSFSEEKNVSFKIRFILLLDEPKKNGRFEISYRPVKIELFMMKAEFEIVTASLNIS